MLFLVWKKKVLETWENQISVWVRNQVIQRSADRAAVKKKSKLLQFWFLTSFGVKTIHFRSSYWDLSPHSFVSNFLVDGKSVQYFTLSTQANKENIKVNIIMEFCLQRIRWDISWHLTNPLLICTWFLKNQVWKIKFEKSSWTNFIFCLFGNWFLLPV